MELRIKTRRLGKHGNILTTTRTIFPLCVTYARNHAWMAVFSMNVYVCKYVFTRHPTNSRHRMSKYNSLDPTHKASYLVLNSLIPQLLCFCKKVVLL